MNYGDGKGSGFLLTGTVDTVDVTSLYLFSANMMSCKMELLCISALLVIEIRKKQPSKE